jgi:hypothetical protein
VVFSEHGEVSPIPAWSSCSLATVTSTRQLCLGRSRRPGSCAGVRRKVPVMAE